MVKKKVTFNPFNPDSITQAIREVQTFKAQHETRVDEFLRRLAEYGVVIAQGNLETYSPPAVFTGEVKNSVHMEERGYRRYAIVSDSEHSAFVEFGTGQLGSVKPHPIAGEFGWAYNIGEHIQYADETLTYGDRVIPQGTYYWFYFKDGRWWITQGMVARPFMYDTALNLEKIFKDVAKEVFK